MFVLHNTPSIANQFLGELRDAVKQKDRLRFRKNLERLGEIMAYEVSKKLKFSEAAVETPLGTSTTKLISEQPVLVTILRAGLPFFQGFINFFDHADCGFIGAFRKEDEQHITIRLEYLASPDLNNKTLIVIDPMLATGRSILDSLNALHRNGSPSHVHIVSLVAAPEGIEYLNQHVKIPFTIWTCAVDEKLNPQFYIVPGLGDAGDLSFGEKL